MSYVLQLDVLFSLPLLKHRYYWDIILTLERNVSYCRCYSLENTFHRHTGVFQLYYRDLSIGKRSKGGLSLSVCPHLCPPNVGGRHRCPRGSSLSLSCHSWSACCQWGNELPNMEKGSHCSAPSYGHLSGYKLVRRDISRPPGLHTHSPVPGADLVSTCTSDRRGTEKDQPLDLSQEDGYGTLTRMAVTYSFP